MTASSCSKMKQVVLFLWPMDAWRLGVEPARSGAIATSAIGSLAAGLLPDRPAFGGQVTNWVESGWSAFAGWIPNGRSSGPTPPYQLSM